MPTRRKYPAARAESRHFPVPVHVHLPPMPLQIKSCFYSVLSNLCHFLYSGLFRLLAPLAVVKRQPSNSSKERSRDDSSQDTAKLGPGRGQSPQIEDPGVTGLHRQFSHDPYIGLAAVGIGLTGVVLKIDQDRVVKKAKAHPLENLSDSDRFNVQYMNDINRSTLAHEIQVYERLGDHKGIIPCICASEYGIVMPLAKHGDLENYMEANPEPPDYVKMDWILSLIDALSYARSRSVFLDEIALRNILVVEGQLKLADFGQSILLPAAADANTICENDLTATIEMLHLGWIIYSVAVWQVHKYYFFDRGNMHWREPQALPNTDKLFCGRIIEKCWRGEYANMDALNEEAHFLLHGLDA